MTNPHNFSNESFIDCAMGKLEPAQNVHLMMKHSEQLFDYERVSRLMCIYRNLIWIRFQTSSKSGLD